MWREKVGLPLYLLREAFQEVIDMSMKSGHVRPQFYCCMRVLYMWPFEDVSNRSMCVHVLTKKSVNKLSVCILLSRRLVSHESILSKCTQIGYKTGNGSFNKNKSLSCRK